MSKRLLAGVGIIILALAMVGVGLIPGVPEPVRGTLFAQAPALILLGAGLLGIRQHQDAQAARLATVEAKVDATHASVAQAAGVKVKE